MGGILKILASKHSMARFDIDHTLIHDSDFRKAKLEYCFFNCGTQFHITNFTGTFLENCKFDSRFSECDFRYSFWSGINAYESKFEECLFLNVRFENCNFSCTCFRGCAFLGCTFVDCDISQAQFNCSSSMVKCTFIKCDLDRIRLPELFIPEVIKDSENVPYIPMVCPDEGEIIGYKKSWAIDNGLRYPVLITLRIPADARRSSGFGRKCRCDKAKVLGIYDIKQLLEPVGMLENGAVDAIIWKHIGDKLSDDTVAYSKFAISPLADPFPYRVGQWVYPDEWDDNRFDECSHGIHFFISAQEAVDY